jgi:hypothetical protein
MSPDPVREETGGEAFEVPVRTGRASELAFVRDTLEHYANGSDSDSDDGLRARQALDALDAYCAASASSSKDEEGRRAFGEGEHLLKLSLDADRVVSELICVGKCLPPDDGPSNESCWLRTWADNEDLAGYVEDLHELGVWRISATFDGDCPTITLREQQPPAPSVSQQGTGERMLREVLLDLMNAADEIRGFYGIEEKAEGGQPDTEYDCAQHELAHAIEAARAALVRHRLGLAPAPPSGETGGPDPAAGLPDELRVLFRDQSIVIPRDAAVFDMIAAYANAPSATMSAEIPAPPIAPLAGETGA